MQLYYSGEKHPHNSYDDDRYIGGRGLGAENSKTPWGMY
jgi:hypothetical protein